ncbi:hypothetical protein OO009_04640 [Flavobacteriaceae bacterium KMM 6897]|nr:hypothetical protein [Flavobacteriaceae bacterium KMM 6897]
MIKVLKYLTLSILISMVVSCSNKIEVLKANLQFEGNCCSGELILYDNYTFKISYTTFSDDWGSTLKNDYRIEGNKIILEAGELFKRSGNITITEVGDLFTKKYQFKYNSLVPDNKGFSNIDITTIDQSFFRLPCLFKKAEKQGTYDMFLFDFCDSLLELDTINMDKLEFDPLPHVKSCNVNLLLPENITLDKVQRFVYIYPTIWSNYSDNITQYIQLDKLVYKSSRELICKDNTFFYPEIEISKSILNEFDKIDQVELNEAVLNELNSRDVNADDRRKWLTYVTKFKNKDFSNQSNDLFHVNYHEIYLDIQLDINGKKVDKVLWTKSYYGN